MIKFAFILSFLAFVIEQLSEFNAVANIEASRYDIETFSPDTKRQLKKVFSFLLIWSIKIMLTFIFICMYIKHYPRTNANILR